MCTGAQAGTDSRFVRAVGVPCFGFSPIRNTPILLHNHDERLRVDEFTTGIEVYMELLRDLGNAPHAPGGCFSGREQQHQP